MSEITEDAVREAMMEVIDPEVGVNIVDLGLVERLKIDGNKVRIGLIMTTPACPQGEYICDKTQATVEGRLGGEVIAVVHLLDEPDWSPERMSGAARDMMGWG